jgi:hypothetical protein
MKPSLPGLLMITAPPFGSSFAFRALRIAEATSCRAEAAKEGGATTTRGFAPVNARVGLALGFALVAETGGP